MITHSNKRPSGIAIMRPSLLSPGSGAPLAASTNDEFRWRHRIQQLPFQNAIQSSSKAIAPAAIIGGTASIYTAALSHTSSTLTPLSVFYLLLLALNYSIMPRLSKKYVHPKTNKQSLALTEEIVKLSMGIGGFLLTDHWSSVRNKWTVESSLIAAGLPSALYAIQGVLTYTAYQNLDSVTFNGLTQVKTLSAALCCYLVLGKVQSYKQVFALGLLSLSTVVFQGTYRDWRWFNRRKSSQNDATAAAAVDAVAQNKKNDGDAAETGSGETKVVKVDAKKRLLLGIVPCLIATLLSGLAGAFSQKSLQMVVGSMERNAFFYSAEISFFSAVCLLVSMGGDRMKRMMMTTANEGGTAVSKKEQSIAEKSGWFDHWSWTTLIPIVVKATGGTLTALVHKHSGSVMKGFSLVLGLVFSALLQTILDGEDLTMGQIFGTALVLMSSWIHFTSPP